MNDSPKLWTIPQAAKKLGLASSTLRDWRKKHRAHKQLDPNVRRFVSQFLKVGRSIRIPREAIEEFRGNGSPNSKDEFGPAILEVLSKILDVHQEIRDLLRRPAGEEPDTEESPEGGGNLRFDLKNAWGDFISEGLEPPFYFLTLSPARPSSKRTLTGRFKSLLRLLRADNGGREPEFFSVFERQGEGEGRLHLHALLAGVENFNLSNFAPRRELRYRRLRDLDDLSIDYLSEKAARGNDFELSARKQSKRFRKLRRVG